MYRWASIRLPGRDIVVKVVVCVPLAPVNSTASSFAPWPSPTSAETGTSVALSAGMTPSVTPADALPDGCTNLAPPPVHPTRQSTATSAARATPRSRRPFIDLPHASPAPHPDVSLGGRGRAVLSAIRTVAATITAMSASPVYLLLRQTDRRALLFQGPLAGGWTGELPADPMTGGRGDCWTSVALRAG